MRSPWQERAVGRYYERKERGVCVRCGNPKTPTSLRCNDCNVKRRQSWAKNKHKFKKQQQDLLLDLKIQTFNQYGGAKCNCCGEDVLLFLALDHIHNNGNEERKRVGRVGTNFYRYLRENNWPSGYQVLCHSCNQGKALNHKMYGIPECPHKVIYAQVS